MVFSEILPSDALIKDDLTGIGYHIQQHEPVTDSLCDAAISVGSTVGATSMGVRELKGTGDDAMLLRHTESIIMPEPTLPEFFALGCLRSAESGGETVVYDARKVARAVLDNFPELAAVRIGYVSTVYEGQGAEHDLVTDHPIYGPVLRFRSEATTNSVIDGLPAGMSERDMFNKIDQVLDDSEPYVHTWSDGELIVINNHMTLHSRLPYQGERHMIRFRYDDPFFKTVPIPATSNE